MTAVLRTEFSNLFPLMEIIVLVIQNPLKLIPGVQIAIK